MTANIETTGGAKASPSSNDKKNQKSDGKYPDQRVLIAKADSFQLFIDTVEKTVTDDGYAVNRPRSYTIRLKKSDLIEGLPATASGSSITLTPDTAKGMGISFEDLCSRIEDMGNYGLLFAFLDDPEASKKVISQLHRQAIKENNVQVEAMSQGVVRSNLALPEDRLL